MYQTTISEFEELKTIFDYEDIITHQLLLIKLYKIIVQLEQDLYTISEKEKLFNFLRSYFNDLGLNKIITIDQLNNLFIPEINELDLTDKEIYVTIYNIFIEELDLNSPIFSTKIKNIIIQLVDRIQNNQLDPIIIDNPIVEHSENNNFNYANKEFFDADISLPLEKNLLYSINTINNEINKDNFNKEFEIINPIYLKEYIIRKNLKPYICNNCGLSSWQNNPLILYLHSKTGKYSNKDLNNLEFLCPNCYSQIGE